MLRKPGIFSTTPGRKLVCFLVHAFLWFSAIPWGLYYTSVQHFHSLWGQSPTCSCRHLISGGTQWPPSSWQVWKFDVVSAMKRIYVKTENITPPSEPTHTWEVSWSSGSCVSKSKDTKMDYGGHQSTAVKKGICDPLTWKRNNWRRDIVKVWRRWMQNDYISFAVQK